MKQRNSPLDKLQEKFGHNFSAKDFRDRLDGQKCTERLSELACDWSSVEHFLPGATILKSLCSRQLLVVSPCIKFTSTPPWPVANVGITRSF